jgi:hypothetical protein
MLEKSDMERVKDSTGRHIPQAISFGVRSVANEDAWARALINLGVMSLDEGKCTAPDFAKV